MMFRRRGILYATGAMCLAAPVGLWLVVNPPWLGGDAQMAAAIAAPTAVRVAPDARAVVADSEIVSQLKADPMVVVRRGHERLLREVQQYRATLAKQERLGSKLTAVQEVEIRVRHKPHTVYMLWRKNADQARRALYMDAPEFRDKRGQRIAKVEPNGAIIRAILSEVTVPIDGDQARQSSRRTIDECGFDSTFSLLERYNKLAAEQGVLKLVYGGTGVVNGRPTYVIIRDLPYDGPKSPYPDARMVLHLDQELLLPVAVYSYADHEQKTLLGSYVFTDIELNPAFDEKSFRF